MFVHLTLSRVAHSSGTALYDVDHFSFLFGNLPSHLNPSMRVFWRLFFYMGAVSNDMAKPLFFFPISELVGLVLLLRAVTLSGTHSLIFVSSRRFSGGTCDRLNFKCLESFSSP